MYEKKTLVVCLVRTPYSFKSAPSLHSIKLIPIYNMHRTREEGTSNEHIPDNIFLEFNMYFQ